MWQQELADAKEFSYDNNALEERLNHELDEF